VTLLSHLGSHGCQVREEHAAYGDGTDDFDPDSDSDPDLDLDLEPTI